MTFTHQLTSAIASGLLPAAMHGYFSEMHGRDPAKANESLPLAVDAMFAAWVEGASPIYH